MTRAVDCPSHLVRLPCKLNALKIFLCNIFLDLASSQLSLTFTTFCTSHLPGIRSPSVSLSASPSLGPSLSVLVSTFKWKLCKLWTSFCCPVAKMTTDYRAGALTGTLKSADWVEIKAEFIRWTKEETQLGGLLKAYQKLNTFRISLENSTPIENSWRT